MIETSVFDFLISPRGHRCSFFNIHGDRAGPGGTCDARQRPEPSPSCKLLGLNFGVTSQVPRESRAVSLYIEEPEAATRRGSLWLPAGRSLVTRRVS